MAGIAEKLANEQEVHEIYGLGDAGLFDEFFCFLQELSIMKVLEQLAPRRHRKRQSPVPFSAVMLIYLMRIVAGLNFFYHLGPVLLQSQSLMHLVGFNGRQVEQGVNRRSLDKSKTDREDKNNTEIRGPVCPEFIASFIVAIAGKTLERVFNKVISILAAHSFFPRRIKVLLDASDLESTERCEGRGQVTKEKGPELRRRRGRIKKIRVTVFGFKIWVVWDPNSRLPIAMRFATIETHDVLLAKEVIAQAITNLGEHAKIVSIAMDRGFMDGKLLWWLESMGIIFYIPAKSNQNVYDDALSLVKDDQRVTRERKRTTGHGKNRKPVTDTWDVVGIEGLTTAGFLVHAYLTILTMALTRAFRDWMIQQEKLEYAGENTGIRKFRRKVRQENSNKCIVFHNDRYAIFFLFEILILSGKTVTKPRGVPEEITKEDILRKYGALLE